MTWMITRRRTLRALPVGMFAAAHGASFDVRAQEAFDTLKIIVGFPPGGSADVAARWLGSKLAPGYAKTAIVDNRPGAAGRIGIETLKSSPPDGRTMLLTPASVLTVYPHVYRQLSYNPVTDFSPVSVVSTFVHGFAVGPAVPAEVKTLTEFGEWAKANPGKANCGNPGEGSLPHFLTMVLARALGAPIQPIPYRGGAPAIPEMLSGQLAALMLPDGTFVPLTKDNRVRVLATSGTKRSQFFPDVPTFLEQGVKEIVVTEWYGLLMPTGVPAPIVARASEAVRTLLALPDVAEVFAKSGMVPTPTTPAELASMIRAETEYWGPIIKSTGFKPLE